MPLGLEVDQFLIVTFPHNLQIFALLLRLLQLIGQLCDLASEDGGVMSPDAISVNVCHQVHELFPLYRVATLLTQITHFDVL